MGRIKLLNYPFFIHLKINTDPQISIFKTAQSKIHHTDLTGNAKQTLSLLLLPKEMLQKICLSFPIPLSQLNSEKRKAINKVTSRQKMHVFD